jgi:TRAP-type C4-dicarboxylate transport system substrate-binding protein
MAEEDDKKGLQTLADNGITVEEGSGELRASLQVIGDTMSQEWAARAGEAGAALLETYRNR